MKKTIALLLFVILCMSTSAFAATYTCENISFEYDDSYFSINMEDHQDNESEELIILSDKLGDSIRIHLRELDENELFPTKEETAEALHIEVVQMDEWANFNNVLTYDVASDDQVETVFIVPVEGTDNEMNKLLTVNIVGMIIEDKEAAELSSDMISEVVDTLKILGE